MNIIGLIPARGGSKSIPRKNIKFLNKKPLIEYSIDAAINSEVIDRTIVTTDDDETDIITFYFDGTNYFGVASLAFDTPSP